MKKHYQSVNHKLMRELNISLILSHLRTKPSQTRAVLAEQTGLTRSSVTNLVDELVERGLVCETGLVPSQGGRPGTTLELNPAAGCAIAVEFRIGSITALLTDFVGKPRQREHIQTDISNPDSAIQQAEQLIDHLLADHAEKMPLGIGVGIGGIVNIQDGTVQFVSSLKNWRNVSLKAQWSARYKLPVYMGNEAHIAALGERYFGAAAGCNNFVYLDMVGYGIGAGIVINGRLFQGINGYAGEVGHTVLDIDGLVCACGKRGCWETLVGTEAIVSYIRDCIARGETSQIVEMVHGDLSRIDFDIVCEALHSGDSLASKACHRVSLLTATGINNLINVFNPEMVILGGTLGLALEPFLSEIKDWIESQALPPMTGTFDIRVSQLGTDTCLMGAAALVLDEILREPFWQATQ